MASFEQDIRPVGSNGELVFFDKATVYLFDAEVAASVWLNRLSFSITETGSYSVCAFSNLVSQSTVNTNSSVQAYLAVNGVNVKVIHSWKGFGSVDNYTFKLDDNRTLNQGDTIQIRFMRNTHSNSRRIANFTLAVFKK